MKIRTLPALILLFGCAVDDGSIVSSPERFELTWSDEFDGAADTLPDLSMWQFDLGTGPNSDGWGNQELQFYTGRAENVSLDGEGNLRIRARRESFGNRDYTSSRIRTQGAFDQEYGRFEARIKLPAGQGIWPAFWMLGANFDEVGWPTCGEIDIMEFRGQNTDTVSGAVHGPGYSGGNPIYDEFRDETGTFDDDFHVFAIEWDPGRIAWFVDDQLFHLVTTAEVRAPGNDWVFDHPFFLILNVAVGGSFVGAPSDETPFPAEMLVDYVRVYRRVQ